MRSCCLLWIVIVFTSCVNNHSYENAKEFSFQDFSEVKVLNGSVLEFDSLIMRPSDLVVFDSLLLLVDYYDERFIQIYNLHTKQKVASRISSGQGPNDMIQPVFVKNDGDCLQLYDMATSYLFSYDLATFIEEDSPKYQQKIKLGKTLIGSVESLKDKIYGYSYSSESQLFVFDEKSGKEIGNMVKFPKSNIDYSDTEKIDAYYMGAVSNKKDRLAVCYSMTDLIDWYDLNGNLLKRIHGPEQFFSYFKEYRDGNVVGSSMDRDRNRDAYFSPHCVDNRLFVLYDGEHVNAPGHDSLCEYLFSFTWDGAPDMIYELEDPIFTYTVDTNRKKIYGISNKPEYHIVEFTY